MPEEIARYGLIRYGQGRYGVGPAAVLPAAPDYVHPPEQYSIFIHRTNDIGGELATIYDARDHDIPATFSGQTIVKDYRVILEDNKVPKFELTLDDPKRNLEEVGRGYTMSIDLDNSRFGDYRSWSFERKTSAGAFSDNFNGTVLTPGAALGHLTGPDEFGKYSNGIRCTGAATSNATTPDSSFFDMANAFLFAAWVKPRGGDGRLCSKLTFSPTNGYHCDLINGRKFRSEIFLGGVGDTIESTTVLDDSKWFYCVAWWTTTQQGLAIFDENKTLVEIQTRTPTNASIGLTSAVLAIGSDPDGSTRVTADMDEIFFMPGGTSTLPTDLENLIITKIAKSTVAPKRYFNRATIHNVERKGSSLILTAFQKELPDALPIFDLIYEGQFADADEDAFAFERTMDISAVVSNTNVDILFQRADGTDLISTDKIIHPFILQIPKARFIDAQTSTPELLHAVSGADFRYVFTDMKIAGRFRIETEPFRVAMCLDYNGVTGDYRVVIGQYDSATISFVAKTNVVFTSDGSSGAKWVYHDFSSLDAFTEKDSDLLFVIGIEPVNAEGWTSGTPLRWHQTHSTDQDADHIGVVETNTGVTEVTPGNMAHYWYRGDDLTGTMDTITEPDGDFTLINDTTVRILDSDTFQVPDDLIIQKIPGLILGPAGATGGFAIGTYFYSTGAKNADDFITRILDKDGQTAAFSGRITDQDLGLYVARGGSALDHIKNIMRLSDSRLIKRPGVDLSVENNVRSNHIRDPSIEFVNNSPWKEDLFLGGSASPTTVAADVHTGLRAYSLTTAALTGSSAELYQDMSDVSPDSHFQIWHKGDMARHGLDARIYRYGTFDNPQDISISTATADPNVYERDTFTITQAIMTALGENRRCRLGISFANTAVGNQAGATHFIDDISPITLYGVSKKGSIIPPGDNEPKLFNAFYINKEPNLKEGIRKGFTNFAIQKAGRESTGRPFLGIAQDIKSINRMGTRGKTRQSKQRSTLQEMYDEAVARLNVEKERQLILNLTGQWGWLYGEQLALYYTDFGINTWEPYPVTSIEINPSRSIIRSRLTISESSSALKDNVEEKEGELEDVFEAPVSDKFTQLYFYEIVPDTFNTVRLEDSSGNAIEDSTDLTTLNDGTTVCIFHALKEITRIGAGTTDYVNQIQLKLGVSDVQQDVIRAGYKFNRVPNQWIIIVIFQEE